MMDLDTLHIFTPENYVYAGANKINFKSIELWLQVIKENIGQPSTKPNTLGLFGPASTGKTAAANLISKELNQPLVAFNCAAMNQNNLWSYIYNTANQMYPNDRVCDTVIPFTYFNSNRERISVLQNCIILLDECHELTNKTQGQLLSVLDGSTKIVYDSLHINKRLSFGFSNVTWVLSTTDSGKLLYPLSTRLYSIVLNEYSEKDVVEIIKLNYSFIEDNVALVLGRAAKLIPRVALELTKQYIGIFKNSNYTKETALIYINNIKQTNEYGLDITDEKILNMLKESKEPLSKSKRTEKNIISIKLDKIKALENPSKKELIEIINLQKELQEYKDLESQLPNMPRSRQDISTFCRLYDMRDLEVRLGYMEKLGVVTKTKSGIIWKRDIM